MGQRIVVRGGWVLTMDPALGDQPGADVLVDDGVIVAIAPGLDASGATVIDARDCVVVPGFVDAHRHLWQTFLRGMLPDCTLTSYMRDVLGRAAPLIRPDDGYTGTLLGALECLNAGITTVYDWSHALAGPEDSDARIAALQESGIRGYFAPNTPPSAEWYSWDQPRTHPEDIRRLRVQYFADDHGRLRLGAALRSPGQVPDHIIAADWAMARELGLMISIHAGARHEGSASRDVETLHRLGLLGPDVNLAHGNEFTDQDLAKVRDSGSTIAMSPYAELVGGHGLSATARFVAHGISPALSADAVVMAPGDMFSEMRVAYAGARAEQQPTDPTAPYRPTITARDVLAMATINGARAIGLDDVCGTLTVGKAADLVVIRGDQVGTAPVVDPVATVVTSADTSNVDTVLVDGQVVKRNGRLTTAALEPTIRAATRIRERIVTGMGADPTTR